MLLRTEEQQEIISPRFDIKFDINIKKRRKELQSFHGISKSGGKIILLVNLDQKVKMVIKLKSNMNLMMEVTRIKMIVQMETVITR